METYRLIIREDELVLVDGRDLDNCISVSRESEAGKMLLLAMKLMKKVLKCEYALEAF